MLLNRLHTLTGPVAAGLALWASAAAYGQVDCALRWDPRFANPGFNSNVRALEVYNDGAGAALYAGGPFITAPGNVAANRVAKWNGNAWVPLGAGVGGVGTPEVFALTSDFNNRLYVAGTFTQAGGAGANRIASWDGTNWAALGTGISSTVFSLAGTNQASPIGPALYAGGAFNTAGGVVVNSIGRWNGANWAAVGSGSLAIDGTIGTINALLIFQNELYAGGTFVSIDGVACNYIAKYNGANWAPLSSGMGGEAFPNVFALTVFNGQVIAGGNFTTAGGTPANYIARWNGAAWAALGTGMGGVPNLRAVNALAAWDDGTGGGEALYAGGLFITAGGQIVNSIAKWNGAAWSPLRQGMNSGVQSLQGFGNSLYAGGLFTTAGARTSQRIARWTCIPLEPEACCFRNDGSCRDLNFNDCTAAGGEAQGPGTQCATFFCPQPPQGCCLPDGSCADLTAQVCQSQGGTPQGIGVMCSSQPCLQACCLPNNTCADLSPPTCTAQGGTPQGAATNCNTTACPQACCLPDNTCEEVLPADCTARGGTAQGAGSNCTTAVCAQACCLPDNSCANLLPAACAAQGGTSQGRDTHCSTTQCPQACCLPNNTCQDLLAGDCTSAGGTPQGAGSNCATAVCPQACCLPDNSCVNNLVPNNCRNQGGTPQGVGTTCATVQCPQACCFPNGNCQSLPAADCVAQGAEPQGVGSNCQTANCAIPVGACCLPSQDITLNFESDAAGNPLPAGTIVGNQWQAWGVTFVVDNFRAGHPDVAVLFDSSSPSGDDADLQTPGQHASNNVPYNNIMVIAENDLDANGDGLIDDPDDEARRPAGYIDVKLDAVYNEGSIVLIDLERNESHTVEFLRGGVRVGLVPIVGGDNNAITKVTISATDFDEVKWSSGGSGGICEIYVTQGERCQEMTEADCTTAGGTYLGDATACAPGVCIGGPRDGNVQVRTNQPGAYVEVAAADGSFAGGGFADFSQSYEDGTALRLTALDLFEGKRFVRWVVDGVPQPAGQLETLLTVHGDRVLDMMFTNYRDCNGNGVPDESDPLTSPVSQYVSLFAATLLSAEPDYVLICMMDQNGDGVVNGADVGPFVTGLLSE